MCQFFSAIVTKNHEILHKIGATDSHEDLVNFYNLDDNQNPNLKKWVRIEFVPTDCTNIDSYKLVVDEKEIPIWLDKDIIIPKLRALLSSKILIGEDQKCLIGGFWILKDCNIGYIKNCVIHSMHGSSRIGSMRGSSQIDSMHDLSQIGSMFGSSQIGSMHGSSRIGSMRGSSQIDSMHGSSRIDSMFGSSRIGSMHDLSQIGLVHDLSQIDSMHDSSQIGSMFGLSQIGSMHDSSQIDSMHDLSQIVKDER